MKRFGSLVALTVTLFAHGAGAASGADVAELLPYVPQATNALVVVRAGDILKAARGAPAVAAEESRESLIAGVLNIPSWVDVVVRATRINPSASGPAWSAAVVPLPPEVGFEALAKHEGGVLQDLAGRPAFRSSRGYVVQLKPGLIGVMRTGSRQDAAFWIVQTAGGSAGMSGYLSEAAAGPGQIILAFDATNMVDPEGVRIQLMHSQALEGKPAEQAAAAKLLVGLRGAKAALTLGAETQIEIRLDFSSAVSDAEMMKTLLVEFLDNNGAALPELAGATASADGASVVIRTTFSDESLRKLMTLVAAPTPAHSAETAPAAAVRASSAPASTTPPPAPSTATPQSQAAAASRTYYRNVSRLISDLRRQLRSAKDYEKTALWHDRFADQIDQLSVVGIDPAVVDFGAEVSRDFRAVAASLRGESTQVQALSGTVTTEVRVNNGFWGYTGAKYGAFGGYIPGPGELQSNVGQVRAAQAQAVAQGAEQRNQLWQAIDEAQNRTRIAMSQKYGIDFDAK